MQASNTMTEEGGGRALDPSRHLAGGERQERGHSTEHTQLSESGGSVDGWEGWRRPVAKACARRTGPLLEHRAVEGGGMGGCGVNEKEGYGGFDRYIGGVQQLR